MAEQKQNKKLPPKSGGAKGKKSQAAQRSGQGLKRSGAEAVKAGKRTGTAWISMVPLLLVLLALLLLIFFIFVDHQGSAGAFLTRSFTWLFGGARWLLPFFLVLGAIFWRQDYESNNLLTKAIISGVVFLAIDCLLYDIVVCWGGEQVLSAGEIWKGTEGAVGGGVIGNNVGQFLVGLIGEIATPILLIALILFFGVFLFGLTPTEAVVGIRDWYRRRREEKAAAAYDGDDEEDELPAHPAMVKKRPTEGRAAQKAYREDRKERQEDRPAFDPDVPIGDCNGEETDPETLPAGAQIPLRRNPVMPEQDDFAGLTEPEKQTDGIPGAPDELDEILRLIDEEPEAEELPTEERKRMDTAGEEDEKKEYLYPPLTLLAVERSKPASDFGEEKANAEKLVETLRSFKVETHVENISRGPTVTRYELVPEKGVRVRAIANLADDIALNLAAEGVRIEAPIPGKAAVGIEVPKKSRETVYLRTLFDTDEFKHSKYTLTAALGKDVGGNPVYMDIAKMPHLLIAGTTGSGKSVCMNSLILSLLYKYSPDDVKMIMIDPKKVEFNIYNGLPHLIIPVVSQAKKAAGALSWAVIEMERRYELIEDVGVRDLRSYNEVTANDPDREYMPLLVIFIDELADLMMTAPSEVEESICRIAQKGRAAGLHLVIGTQRPSVDVITGLIKANVPSRIAFTVSSQVDSRTIIDIGGAEKLIGRGDMLFAPIGVTKPYRIQGAFVSDAEVEAVTGFIKENAGDTRYDDDVMKDIEKEAELCGVKKGKGAMVAQSADPLSEDADPMLEAAIEVAIESGKISTSLIQRRLKLGYGRAAKLIDMMQEMGVVSPPDGQKPRSVLISATEWAERKMRGESEE